MKRNVRGLALLLALALVLLAGCGQTAAKGPQAPEKSLTQQGQELVALMAEMAGSDRYREMLTQSDEMTELMEAAGEGDFSDPEAVYCIRFPESALLSMLEMAGAEGLDDLSQGLRESIQAKAATSLPGQLNAMGGTNVLAAASLCTASKTFLDGELTENVIYLYLYQDAVPATVAFLPGEDGTVYATGMLILYDGFRAESIEDLSGLLGQLGAEVEEVS